MTRQALAHSVDVSFGRGLARRENTDLVKGLQLEKEETVVEI
jgi:hypothetical protein